MPELMVLAVCVRVWVHATQMLALTGDMRWMSAAIQGELCVRAAYLHAVSPSPSPPPPSRSPTA